MTVKELITRLLEEPMSANICIQEPTKTESEHGIISGVLFRIDNIEHCGGCVYLNFTDWRKDNDKNRICKK